MFFEEQTLSLLAQEDDNDSGLTLLHFKDGMALQHGKMSNSQR